MAGLGVAMRDHGGVTFDELGPNSGLVEDLYERFRQDPTSIPERWRKYFTEHPPDGNGEQAAAPVMAAPVIAAPVSEAPDAVAAEPVVATPSRVSATAPAVPEAESAPLRGVAARIAENMEASLGVPTATSVRTVPAKLLEINRQILNNHLARTGEGKVSFTHLIAFAVVRALGNFPHLNTSYEIVDGKPSALHHVDVNLGLAVDVEKSDGSRSLLVPNIKGAGTRPAAS